MFFASLFWKQEAPIVKPARPVPRNYYIFLWSFRTTQFSKQKTVLPLSVTVL